MLNQITNFFKTPHMATRTSGIGDGMILQFHHGYLKIYPEANGAYKILQYRYGDNTPLGCDVVPMNGMQRYANKFDNKFRERNGSLNIEEQLKRIPPPRYCERL